MANTSQAAKRARQAEKHRIANKPQISKMSTVLKQAQATIASGEVNQAKEAYKSAASIVDKLARKGLIHPNKAARHKSRLNKKLASIAKA